MIKTVNINEIATLQQSFKNSLIVAKPQEDLIAFLSNQIFLACVYRGISKTDEERKIMAMMILPELKTRFAYLSLPDIEKAFRQQRYGADYSKTICPEAFIRCLDNSNFTITQKTNRQRIEAEDKPTPKPQTKEERREEAKKILISDYQHYCNKGIVYNFKNWNYLYITKVLNFKLPYSTCKDMMQRAENSAATKKHKDNSIAYRSVKSVLRDMHLIQSKDFKNLKKTFFRSLYIEEFFKQLQTGKYQNAIFSPVEPRKI